MGAHGLPPEDIKSHRALVCFSEAEWRELTAAAEIHGLRPSTYVRVATLQQVRGITTKGQTEEDRHG